MTDWVTRLAELDVLCTGAVTDYDASTALKQAEDETAPEFLEAHQRLRMAVDYMVVADPDGRARDGVFAPQIEFTDGRRYPPRLEDLDPDTVDIWQNAALVVIAPVLAARLGDLLWTLRLGDRSARLARRAIAAYTELARRPLGEFAVDQVDGAARAAELAAELRDDALRDETAALLIDLAERSLEAPEVYPGVVLRALAPPVEYCPSRLAVRRDELLVQAARAFADDPFVYAETLELQAQTLPPADRPALFRAIVATWRNSAEATTGIDRHRRLQQALEAAMLHGLTDEANAIRVEIQSIDSEDLGFYTVSSETDGTEIVEHFRREFLGGSFVETLRNLAKIGPLSGSIDQSQQLVESMRTAGPFSSSVTSSLYGYGNNVVWTAEPGTDARDRYDLAQAQARTATMLGWAASHVIAESLELHGPPSREELIEWLTTPLIPDALAERLAHGILLAVDGDFDAAANTLLPRIEAVIRQVTQAAGIAVITQQRGDRPGGALTLGELLRRLKGVLDEDLRSYFINSLCDPLGLNLRNRALHGLWSGAGPVEVLVLLNIISLLAGLEIMSPPIQDVGSA